MYEINNTMTQENRYDLWCSSCENECTGICKLCVFAGCPTRYKVKRPMFSGMSTAVKSAERI